MNIIKNSTIVILVTAMFAIGSVGQAHAGFFDNSSDWSFAAVVQGIQNIPTSTPSAPAIQSNAVKSVASPAAVKAKALTPVKTYTVSVTAYSSSVDETDSTPFITADGSYVRDGIVATNFLPFGTVIKIPEVYGDKVFVVEDRMNSRYTTNVDVWMASKDLAKQFGRKTLKIEVVS